MPDNGFDTFDLIYIRPIVFKMRVLPVLYIALLSFLMACEKPSVEEEDKFIWCSGTLTDASTYMPLKDVTIMVYATAENYISGEKYIEIIDYYQTDELGKFYINEYKTRLDTYYLGCTDIPEGYQPYYRLRGGGIYDLFLNVNDYYEQNYTRLSIADNHDYTMRLFPVSSCRFVLPVLTEEQKKYKMILEIPGLFGTTNEIYSLNNTFDLLELERVRPLTAANYASGTFQLKLDATVIKTGTFKTFCAPNDTTDVLLAL